MFSVGDDAYYPAENWHFFRGIFMWSARWFAACFAVMLAVGEANAQQYVGNAPICGLPVFVGPNYAGATATFYNGQPVIYIDPSVFNGSTRDFALAHECGHHALGHTLPQGLMARMWASGAQELEADCWAAQQVSQNLARLAANEFSRRQGNNSPAPGYPTGNQRAANIRSCSE